ncbi:hypothetical protein XELAEV_18029140mg, partial [Xenopus laevis]
EYNGRAYWLSDQTTNSDIHLFTDTSEAIGFGAYFKGVWVRSPLAGHWVSSRMTANLTLLELFPIVVAVEILGQCLANNAVVFHSDNMSTVMAINNLTSGSGPVLGLLRHMVLRCLQLNMAFRAKHVPGCENNIADALSCFQWDRFRNLVPEVDLVCWTGWNGQWYRLHGQGTRRHGRNCSESELGTEGEEVDRMRILVWWMLAKGFEEGASATVIGKKMAALAFLFKVMRWKDITKEFIGKQAIRDAKGKGSRSSFEARLFRLAFSWALFGAFGIGALVSNNTAAGGGVKYKDVRVHTHELTIQVKNSKADKGGGGFKIPLAEVFIAVFRKAMTALGLAAKEYGSHYFRIGAATEAARWGLGEEMIRKIGRWESNRFKSYVRPGRFEF